MYVLVCVIYAFKTCTSMHLGVHVCTCVLYFFFNGVRTCVVDVGYLFLYCCHSTFIF